MVVRPKACACLTPRGGITHHEGRNYAKGRGATGASWGGRSDFGVAVSVVEPSFVFQNLVSVRDMENKTLMRDMTGLPLASRREIVPPPAH